MSPRPRPHPPQPSCGHSNLDPHCLSCKALKKYWNQELEAQGVKNAETEDDQLKQWDSFRFTRPLVYKDRDTFEAKRDYYYLAEHFLHAYSFSNSFERAVWALHCEGISLDKILKELRKTRGIYTYRKKIYETIQRLSREMMNRRG